MLLKNYRMDVAPPECLPSDVKVAAWITFDDDLTELLPYLNAELGPCVHEKEPPFLRFRRDGKLIAIYPNQIGIARLRDEEEAKEVLEWIRSIINSVAERKAAIKPSYRSVGEVKPLDVFKLLPRTNCGKCGVATCMAFAATLAHGEAEPGKCSELQDEAMKEKRNQLLRILGKIN
ncbi:MAG: Fe-S cluster protein [Candidatus Lindowbacteria bacterium]|nr:Fe-S cluster protein [Candidatus Lindowbacteria bacterium]